MADENGEFELKVTDEMISSIRSSFDAYDEDKKGYISTKRLGDVMRNFGHNLRHVELRELIAEVDSDGSGTIDFDEFLPLMLEKMREKFEETWYKDLFRVLDKKNKGYIPCEYLRHILDKMKGELELSDEEVDELIAEVDDDGNGQVSFEEFYNLMKS
ncbi:uncharacterized protein LOC135492602 [Lineus longissimus]|uniref:uncharacterized protein LOC135492602 n=1 Tax=Lineus longissimus TaxID=88925 RepID=UPI002B4C614C